MYGFIKKSLPVVALFLVLGGSALAAETAKAEAKATVAPAGPMAGMGMMQGGMQGLSPEKQELVQTIVREHQEKMFPLRQELYAHQTELEALLAKGDADPAKIKAVQGEIAAVTAKKADEYAAYRQRLFKEAGLRKAPHGMGGMGMMGEGGCPMMESMMGGKGMMGKGMMGKGMMGRGAVPADPAHDAHGAAKTKAPKNQ